MFALVTKISLFREKTMFQNTVFISWSVRFLVVNLHENSWLKHGKIN